MFLRSIIPFRYLRFTRVTYPVTPIFNMARAAPSPRSAPPTRSSKRRKTDGDSTKPEDTVEKSKKDVKEEKDKKEESTVDVKAEDEAMEDVKPKVEHDEQEEAKPSSKRKSRASNGAAKHEESKPTTPAKRSRREVKEEADTTKIETVDKEIGELTEKVSSRSTGPATTKTPTKNKYNLTPGQTPFPDYPHPTAEECQNVIDLLSSVHGKPEREMAPPSTTVAGCGNVPAVLDSLMRTMLSAATTSANSSRAFQNIVTKYGLLTSGIGKGSVDWDKVRLGDQHELFLTIQCGGLAANKSKNIKTVLDMVHVENQERRSAILDEKDESKPSESKDTNPPPGIKAETSEQKSDEVKTADENVLSLDYLHSLSTEEAMTKLTSYPGVGVKTASCVLLFNFGRGSFAVDTHVWRLCRWLGWVPNHASRNQTYSHCEVRIPDDMKYDLHALFWKHGKYCPKCRMIPVKDRPQHEKMECPIDGLIKANGGRRQPEEAKRKKSTAKPRATKNSGGGAVAKGKKRKAVSSDEESEMTELSDDDFSD